MTVDRSRKKKKKRGRTALTSTASTSSTSLSGLSDADSKNFAELLTRHIKTRKIAKVALARAIKTKPQYIREIETGRKPPPTLEKVTILADVLGLSGSERDTFLARAREGRAKPESRNYLRSMENAFTQLMEIFSVDVSDRDRIREGDFAVLVNRVRDAFLTAGKVSSESEFVPFLQVIRYNAFLKQLLDGMDTLREKYSEKDLDWVQNELLDQMEELMGLRKERARISKNLRSRERRSG
jgi:transcriptional regulator with XRE-family HTH domain